MISEHKFTDLCENVKTELGNKFITYSAKNTVSVKLNFLVPK